MTGVRVGRRGRSGSPPLLRTSWGGRAGALPPLLLGNGCHGRLPCDRPGTRTTAPPCPAAVTLDLCEGPGLRFLLSEMRGARLWSLLYRRGVP